MQLNKEQKRQKKKKSGSAIFMYCVIGATLVISLVCFILYYGNFFRNYRILSYHQKQTAEAASGRHSRRGDRAWKIKYKRPRQAENER